MGQRNNTHKMWSLTDLDTGETVAGQYIAEDVRVTGGSTFADLTSINHEDPVVQWLHGNAETVEFSATFFTADPQEGAPIRDDTPEERLDALMRLSSKSLGEAPPVCHFQLGWSRTLGMNVLVELGERNYMEPKADGQVRGITVKLILHKHVEVRLDAIDPTKPERFTRIRRVPDGRTYEQIAKEEYGDALMGVLLRQLNPIVPGMDVADLKKGDPVHMFPEDFLLRQELEPRHHALKSGPGNEAAEKLRRDFFTLRQVDGYTTTFADTSPEER